MSKWEGCCQWSPKKGLTVTKTKTKFFHISFVFQKTLSVESVQQFPKPSHLQRPDSGFNWNNEINLIWWVEGGALTWITGVSSYFNLSSALPSSQSLGHWYTLSIPLVPKSSAQVYLIFENSDSRQEGFIQLQLKVCDSGSNLYC